ncbi:RTXE polymerase, partial [Pseudoatta argentina]
MTPPRPRKSTKAPGAVAPTKKTGSEGRARKGNTAGGSNATDKRFPLLKLRSPSLAVITLTCADQLAERLSAVFADRDDVRVSRPSKTAEIRVSGLDGTLTEPPPSRDTPPWRRPWKAPSAVADVEMAIVAETSATATNLNHSAEAQSMLMQCLAERGGRADPYRIPESHPNWVGDYLGRIAVVSRHVRDTPPMIPISAGEEFTLVEWGPIDVAGCYFPPRLGRREYEDALESLGEHIRRCSPRPILVGGDFSAHALEWDFPSTDSRGDSTLLWAARHGLVLLNRGRASTFMGAWGEFILTDLEVPTITETLDARFLEYVVAALFPSGWTEELGVTGEEMEKAFARLRGRSRVPTLRHSRQCLVRCGPHRERSLTSCLREGSFSRSWKRARLVFLHKEGRPAESPSAYRRICLLDDAGKLLERIIAARIVRHLSRDGSNLSRGQYGFREGLLMIDAIRQVRSLSE